MEAPTTFKAFVFDLDGTLLDTLPDLVVLTNEIMKRCDCPTHTREEVLSYVGGGAPVLLARALPGGMKDEHYRMALSLWYELYTEFGLGKTKPYPHMPETLQKLKSDGMLLGVLSNKFDAAAREVVEAHYPGMFDLVRGEGPDVPRKPDPKGLLDMLRDLGVSPQQTAYVGDSMSDMQTAVAAGAFPIGVTWGYQSTNALIKGGATVLVTSPAEIADLPVRRPDQPISTTASRKDHS